MIVSTASAVPFIMKGLRAIGRQAECGCALDASALLVSILMRDYRTVGMLTMLGAGPWARRWNPGQGRRP